MKNLIKIITVIIIASCHLIEAAIDNEQVLKKQLQERLEKISLIEVPAERILAELNLVLGEIPKVPGRSEELSVFTKSINERSGLGITMNKVYPEEISNPEIKAKYLEILEKKRQARINHKLYKFYRSELLEILSNSKNNLNLVTDENLKIQLEQLILNAENIVPKHDYGHESIIEEIKKLDVIEK